MLGHLDTSFLASAVVTRRQLFPPNPSVKASVAFLVPHHDGAFWTDPFPAGGAAPESRPEPPQALSARAQPPTIANSILCACLPAITDSFLLSPAGHRYGYAGGG